VVEREGGGPVADFCTGLRRLQQGCGLDRSVLARRLGYSRSQLYEILDGRISRPPEWDRLVEPLVRACTGNDEVAVAEWRRRHDVLAEVYHAFRNQHRQHGTPRSTGVARVVPAQLPTDVDAFTGRATELAELDHHLALTSATSTAVMISVVSGTAGVGKTALAVRWAHRVQDCFPGGQLYVNLRGYDPGPPMTPEQALEGFLRALDVPVDKIPVGMEAKAGLYRSLLNGRRVLVVLDNAHTAEQVRPLLPGSPGCLVVVTSRNRLSGLLARNGAHRVNLDPLPPSEAVLLLRQIIGVARVEAEPDMAVELARRCAYLPLALRISAERVASHPHTTLADLAGELADERDRLNVLIADEDETTAVRSVFLWSYRTLAPAVARLFRLLGLHAGPDISLPSAAVLAGTTPPQARQLLDVLTGVHLLEQTGHDRYRFHDLLRLYAAERAAAEESDHDRATAVRRVLAWYLHTADAAGRVLTPQWRYVPLDSPEADFPPLVFVTYHQAVKWCEAERANLVAATRHAAECGQHVIAWKLPAVLWNFFLLRGHWHDWITTHETGLAATHYLHDRYGEAWIANNLGDGYRGLGRFDEALDHLQQALAAWRELYDRWGEGWTLYNLGTTYRSMGRFDDALEHYQQALARGRKMGKPWGEAWALHSLATTYRSMGRFDDALEHYQQALARGRKMGKPWGEAWALHSLATTYRSMGRFEDAFDHYHQALLVRREINDRWGEGWTLHSVAITYRDLGRFDDALDHYHQALLVYRKINDSWGEGRTLYNIGELLHDTGHLAEARGSWHQALAIFEDLGDPWAANVRARLATLHTENVDQD
jgi:tetratricopeptide (TPR) repeat protein